MAYPVKLVGDIVVFGIVGTLVFGPCLYGYWIMLSKWRGSWPARIMRFTLLTALLAMPVAMILLWLCATGPWDRRVVGIAYGTSLVAAMMLILIGWVTLDTWRGDRVERLTFSLLMVSVIAAVLGIPMLLARLGASDATTDFVDGLMWSLTLLIGLAFGSWIRKRKERGDALREPTSETHA